MANIYWAAHATSRVFTAVEASFRMGCGGCGESSDSEGVRAVTAVLRGSIVELSFSFCRAKLRAN